MKILISILFVFVFVLAVQSQEHIKIKSVVNSSNGDFREDVQCSQVIIYNYVFNEQDSDDADDSGTVLITGLSKLKSVNGKVKSNRYYFLTFYQIHSNILLIDLPPPILLFV